MVKAPKTYESRIILFLDFLSFKEIIEHTVRDPACLKDLLSAIDCLYDIGREDADLYRTRRITTFSDSVVLSYAVNEQSAVYYLLSDVAFAVIALAIKGLLVRGAVTIGDLLHTNRYLVGPAMVKAYELESKAARSPRVLLDRKLIEIARKAHADQHDAQHEAKYVRAFMTQDTDKQYYLDYLSWDSVVGNVGMDDDNYPRYLAKIAEILRSGFAKTDPGVLAKYLWVYEKYNKAIIKFERLGPRNPYRLNNPENYQAVIGLPRLAAEAKEVERIVANGPTSKHAK